MVRLFGEKLRFLRHQSGLTQAELTTRLGLSAQSHIAELESGGDTPSLELVLRAAHVFNVSTDYLLRDAILVEQSSPLSAQGSIGDDARPKQFGVKLQILRQRCGWGQTELARNLELARRGYISNLETGRKLPSLELVVRIADLFNVTTQYLLDDRILVQDVDEPGE